MADMYGSICSNRFQVKDIKKFRTWINNYQFSEDLGFYIIDEENNTVMIGSESVQSPTVQPSKIIYDEDGEYQDTEYIDIDVFAKNLCKHLQKNEVFHLVSGGNQKLCYVCFEHLTISQAHPDKPYIHYVGSDDSKEKCLKLIKTL